MLSLIKRSIEQLHVKATLRIALPSFVSIPLTLVAVALCLSTIGLADYGIFLLTILILNQSHILLFGSEKNLIRHIISPVLSTPSTMHVSIIAICFGGMISGIMAVLLIGGAAPPFAETHKTPILLMLLGIPIQFLWSVQRSAIQAHDRLSLLGTTSLVYMSASHYAPLFIVLLFPSIAGISEFLLGTIIARTAVCIGLFIFEPTVRSNEPVFSLKATLQLVTYGKWMGANQTIQMLFDSADRYILGIIASPAAVALYAVPLQVTQKLAVLPVAMSQVVFNHSVTINKSKSEQTFYGLLLLAPLIAPLFLCVSELFFTKWLGNNYKPIITDLAMILSVAIIFTSLNFIASSMIEGSGMAQTLAQIDGAALLPLLGLIAFMTIQFGPIGTAFAVLFKDIIFFIIRVAMLRLSSNTIITSILCCIFLAIALAIALQIHTPWKMLGLQAPLYAAWSGLLLSKIIWKSS